MDPYSVKESRSFIRSIFKVSIDVFIWLTAVFPVVFLYFFGTPYERGFYCDDASLSFPYKPDSISNSLLICGGFGISFAVVVLVEVLNCIEHSYCRRPCITLGNILYCLTGFAVFLVGFVMQLIVVLVVKSETGVLRPNFFDVCKPDFNRTFCPGYIINFTCTGSDHKIIKDSRQSFPSGHAALAMYIAIFYCIYIQSRLIIRFSHTAKPFLQFGLVFTAVLVGLGRVKDNKHHPTDVIAGFLLGIIIAIFVYKMIGSKVLKNSYEESSDIHEFQTMNQSHGSCTCAQSMDVEQQTKLALLHQPDFILYSKQSEKGTDFQDNPMLDYQHIKQPVAPIYNM